MDNKTKVVLKIAIPVVFTLALIAVGSFYLGANTVTTSHIAGSQVSQFITDSLQLAQYVMLVILQAV